MPVTTHSSASARRARPELVARRFSLWARVGESGAATFDGSGRLLTARLRDTYYRRGLDNTVVTLTREVGAASYWTTERLPSPGPLFDRLQHDLVDLPKLAEDERAHGLATRAIAGLGSAYESDVRAFHYTIGPVPIVPPNHSRAIVLRLTEGCQYNACKFCELYRDTRFRVRPDDEWRQHIRKVMTYFGDGAGIRPSLWVGDASALEAGVDGFAAALRALHEEVTVIGGGDGDGSEGHLFKGDDPFVFDGIYAFADVPRASRLAADEARELRRLGVRRLYLGVETGHAPLLRELKKPHTNEQVREAIRRLHAGGIGAGVILLVGPGGVERTVDHRRDTSALVASLGLDDRDFVFLSPLDEASRATDVAGVTPHDAHRLAAEVRNLRGAIRSATANGEQLRIADYGLDSFVY